MATFLPRSPQLQGTHHHLSTPRSPMAEAFTNLQQSPYHHHHGSHSHRDHQRRQLRSTFTAALEQCLQDFVIQLLPTHEEMAVKEDVRKLLERLIRTIEPNSKLLSFGSTANGFSLRNSDMDLCCLVESDGPPMPASEMVQVLGTLLERETKFRVKPLPHARIPIIKLTLDPSPSLPFGIACDIGFENRLALENTRLLLSYATVDPTRVRTMVLFLKVWSKRRKINSPYQGTLSSYGYVLLVLYFLIHVKNPPVLPNLQTLPPPRPVPYAETHLHDHNIWFFDDIDLLRQRWKSSNTENVAELLIDFFRFYARDFQYVTDVASIRAGLLKKEHKGWLNESDLVHARDCNRLCIEDPFETTYNVARTVTKDGLFLIRGEFMRASKILSNRPESAIAALAQLCLEREELYPPTAPTPLFQPAQTPFATTSPSAAPPPSLLSIPPSGAIPIRPPNSPSTKASSPPQTAEPQKPSQKEASPPEKPGEEQVPGPPVPTGRRGSQDILAAPQPIPEHMAPTRSNWTSPPPSDAPADVKASYEQFLGLGLSLATASSEAREKERNRSYSSSSKSNSDFALDEELVNLSTDMDALDISSSIGSTASQSPPEKLLLAQVDVSQVVSIAVGQDAQAQTPTPDDRSPNKTQAAALQAAQADARLRGRPPLRIPGSGQSLSSARLSLHEASSPGVSGPSYSPRYHEHHTRRSHSGGPLTPTMVGGFPLPLAAAGFGYGMPSGSRDLMSPPYNTVDITPEQLAMNLSIFSYQQQQLQALQHHSPQFGHTLPLYSVADPSAPHRFQSAATSTYSPPRFAASSGESSPRAMHFSYGGSGGSSPHHRAKMHGGGGSRGQGYHGMQPRATPKSFRSGSTSGRSRSGSEASPSPLRHSIDLPGMSPSSPAGQDGRLPVIPHRSPSGIGTMRGPPSRGMPSDVAPPLVEVDLPPEPPSAHLAPSPSGLGGARRLPPKGGSNSRKHSPVLPDVGEFGGSRRLSDLDLPSPPPPPATNDVVVVPTGVL